MYAEHISSKNGLHTVELHIGSRQGLVFEPEQSSGAKTHAFIGEAGHADRLKAWKKPGDIATIPKIEAHGDARITITDDQLFDASYFAIKNISVGYTIPAKVLQAAKIDSIRIFASADNVKLFSAMKGLDPQYNFTGGTGYSYTPTRTVSLGVDINF